MRLAITGATGYVGQSVVQKLLRRDHEIRALVRDPTRAGTLRDLGVDLVTGSVNEAAAVRALVEGTEAVVHLVGIIAEAGRQTFAAVHVGGTEAVVEAAGQAGARLIVHMSALGARAAATTRYQRTKWQAEELVRGSGRPHVILRPSLIAGPGNVPLKMMLDMIRFSPLVPVIGDGRYELQPIWIGDVSEAIARALEREDIRGTFDLGGPERLTYHQVLDRLESALGVHRRRLSIPIGMARFAAAAGTALPHAAPITSEQLQLLLDGSTTDDNAAESRFGLSPRSFAQVAQEICAPFAAHPVAAS